MKLILTFFTLFFLSFNALARSFNSIGGDDGIEIYNVLKNTLNIQEQRNGDAPEAGCYNMTEINFMNMVCVSESCTSEETFDREFFAACFFDQVDDEKLTTIQSVLRDAGLNTDNKLFDY